MLQTDQYSIPYPFTLFDSLTDGVYIVDLAWRFIYANDKVAEIIGRPHEELLGKNIWELYPQAKETIIFAEMHHALEEKRSTHFEVYHPSLNTWFEHHCPRTRHFHTQTNGSACSETGCSA